jgi:amino acid permease
MLYILGVLISYQIILSSLIKYVLKQFVDDKEFIDSQLMSLYLQVPVCALVLFPMSLKRNMSSMRYASLASIAALVYTAVVLTVEMPRYYSYFSTVATSRAVYLDWNIFTGCSMVFFSYTCQIQMLPIYSELQNPSYPRMRKVVQRSIAVDVVFYLTIGIVGYLSQLDLTNPIVLERETLPGHGADYPVLIAVVAMCACLVVAFPVNCFPFRQAFFTQLVGRDTFSQKENFLFVGVVCALTCAVSILFPNIKSVLSLLGGLLAIQMSYALPLVIQVVLSEKKWYAWENLSAIIFFSSLQLMGYGSVVITIYEAVMGLDTMPRWK